jgi:hypothetical protein
MHASNYYPHATMLMRGTTLIDMDGCVRGAADGRRDQRCRGAAAQTSDGIVSSLCDFMYI